MINGKAQYLYACRFLIRHEKQKKAPLLQARLRVIFELITVPIKLPQDLLIQRAFFQDSLTFLSL